MAYYMSIVGILILIKNGLRVIGTGIEVNHLYTNKKWKVRQERYIIPTTLTRIAMGLLT